MTETINCDAELKDKIHLWLKWDQNPITLSQMKGLIEKKDWTQLQKRLMQRLNFGTAGLRGCMRAGFDSMNDLVIIQTAQGLCEYVKQQYEPNEWHKGIVLGYDGRYNSKRFAELSATVFVHSRIKVLLFGQMVPTPFVPFTILQKKCLCGVMVTASHNPKEDNGYKVYWNNGTQIIAPHDKRIQKCILENLIPHVTSWQTNILKGNEFLHDPFTEIYEKYFQELRAYIPETFLKINKEQQIKGDIEFVYTAMHGVGWPFIRQAFNVANLPELIPVKEQQNTDAEFPTVKFPNPEEGKSSLELSIKTADKEGATMILANDPDADRLAYAEKDLSTGQWKVFNGNELGTLLGWWAVQHYKACHHNKTLDNCYILASTVSSKMLHTIAKKEGFHFVETLTGFKWMGNRAIELKSQGKDVLFAFEEAIGFMFSTIVLDKDGISAATHLATMICYLKAHYNQTLKEKLHDIYNEYGYHCTICSYLFCDKPSLIKHIFERLRNYNGPNSYPNAILNGEYTIKYVRDLTTGIDTARPDGQAILPVSSSNQMITFTFENGLVITLRTSGTEPKIKYYAELCSRPEQKDWLALQNLLERMVEAIVEEFLQPNENNLLSKTD